MAAPGPAPHPFGYDAYDAPASQRGRPVVILWFRTYAAAIALFCGGCAVAGMVSLRSTGGELNNVVFVLIAIAAVHAVGAAVPYKPWGWTYAFVLLWLGLFSFLLPAALALLLYWKEPTTRAAFQRFF